MTRTKLSALATLVAALFGVLLLSVSSASAASKGHVKLPAKVHVNKTITVKGTGFSPNLPVYVLECTSKTPPSAKTCDASKKHIVLAHADSKGAFSAKYKIYSGKVSGGKCKIGGKCIILASTANQSVKAYAKFKLLK